MTGCTDPVLSSVEGCQAAHKLIVDIKLGNALPDALHAHLQAIRAAGDGEKLRAFTRQVQKAMEGAL